MADTSHDQEVLEKILRQIPAWSEKGDELRYEYDRQGRLQRLDLSNLHLSVFFLS